MTDYFVVLGERRRPWIDAELLKQKFLTLTAEKHPDRAHGASEPEKQEAQREYALLNSAYQCLREPKDRLRHLLELERGSKPGQVQRIPPDLMNLSLEIGQICRGADGIVTEKTRTTSPLLQVQVFERAQSAMESLTTALGRLESLRDEVLNEVRSLDERWIRDDVGQHDTLLVQLEELYPLLSFYERWCAQLRERNVQLSF